MPVMSLVFVSKKACQHIFVLSDPGVPRTFVGDCNPRQKSWHACPLFSICQGNLLVRPPPPDSMLFSVMNSSLLASNIVGGEGGSQCQ